jgi:hypothetical protein
LGRPVPELDAATVAAVQGLRTFGYSWPEIAVRLDTAKQHNVGDVIEFRRFARPARYVDVLRSCRPGMRGDLCQLLSLRGSRFFWLQSFFL